MIDRTFHQHAIHNVVFMARLRDQRIRHAPAATRRLIRDNALRRVIREALREQAEGATAHLGRRLTSPGRYAIIARSAHDTLGLTGEDCRVVARAMVWYGDVPYRAPAISFPRHWRTEEQVAAEIRDGFSDEVFAPRRKDAWAWWYRQAVEPRIAEAEGRQLVADSETISGYLAATIIHAKTHGQAGSDYSGCSGCEAYSWIRQHPETWDALLARAPVGEYLDGGTRRVVYPHETPPAGWVHEVMGLSKSIYRHPEA